MEDIIDIYEPVYSGGKLLYLIPFIVLIAILAGILVYFFLIKKEKKITLEDRYKETLDSILFLKGELHNLDCSTAICRIKSIMVNFLSFMDGKNYKSYTYRELGKLLISQDFKLLGDIYLNKLDSVLYGGESISNDDIEKILKETGEFITMKFRSVKVD